MASNLSSIYRKAKEKRAAAAVVAAQEFTTSMPTSTLWHSTLNQQKKLALALSSGTLTFKRSPLE